MNRRRISFVALAVIVVFAGLGSRATGDALPAAIRQYPGDTLWALLVMLLLGAVVPRASTRAVALLALAIAFAVEFSQLIRWQWLVTLRQNPLGHLVLGSGFHWPDLVAYTLGVTLGAVFESLAKRQNLLVQLFFYPAIQRKAA